METTNNHLIVSGKWMQNFVSIPGAVQFHLLKHLNTKDFLNFFSISKTALATFPFPQHRVALLQFKELSKKGGCPIIMYAAMANYEALVTVLINHDQKVLQEKDQFIKGNKYGKYGDTALSAIITNPNRENIIRILLDHRADSAAMVIPSSWHKGYRLLSLKARQKNPDDKDLNIMRMLIEAQADVNAQDEDGRTALMNAVTDGHIKSLKVLLAYKADIEVRDEQGKTALEHAADRGKTVASKVLLAYKANPDAAHYKQPTSKPSYTRHRCCLHLFVDFIVEVLPCSKRRR